MFCLKFYEIAEIVILYGLFLHRRFKRMILQGVFLEIKIKFNYQDEDMEGS